MEFYFASSSRAWSLVLLACTILPSVFFFFFQAEDGIRDHCVTGVQTCALPISLHAQHHHDGEDRTPRSESAGRIRGGLPRSDPGGRGGLAARGLAIRRRDARVRSEERRVGKECSSRWSPDQ